MTKSTITKEQITSWMNDANHTLEEPLNADDAAAARAILAMGHELLVAMDSSESVELPLDYLQGHKDGLEWAAQLAESNHPETGDWLYDDPIELAKAIRKGPDMPPVQPVPGYPETLPCPVLLEPGLRFGKGIKTSTMLAALARRAVHESDMAALSPEERVEFQARIEDFKALIAQPAPVVPDGYVMVPKEMTDEIGEAIAMRANCCGGIALDIYDAMLAAAPQSPGSEPATVPGKWIPVSERVPTKQDGSVFLTWNGQYIGKELFLMGSFQCLKPEIITHWMQLPAAPQEVKSES